MTSKLDQLLAYDAFWLIEPNFAVHAKDVLALTPPDAGVSTDRAEGRSEGGYEDLGNGIARVVLSGPMTKKQTSASFLFGGCSTVMVRRAVRAAAASESVKSIVLVIDSPGGQCAGLADLADDVAAAAGRKPVVAYVEDMCCSAALFVASQCSSVYANRTALIGSIGTLAVVEDWSRHYGAKGVDVHVVSSGSVKGAGTKGAPVTEEHLAEFQKLIDGYADQFVEAVARGRGMSEDDVRELATGQVWFPEEAMAFGLIDGVTTEDELMDRMKAGGPFGGSSRAKAGLPSSLAGLVDGPARTSGARLTDLIFDTTQRGEFAPAKAEAAGDSRTLTMSTENSTRTGFLARVGALALSMFGGDGAGAAQPEAVDGGTVTTAPAAANGRQANDQHDALLARIAALEDESKAAAASASAIAASAVVRQSQTFADSLVSAGRILPAERDSAAELYGAALASDHNGAPVVSADGSVAPGRLAEKVAAAYNAKPALKLDKTVIASDPNARTLPSGAGPDPAAIAASWLGPTETGRATLKRLAAEGAQ